MVKFRQPKNRLMIKKITLALAAVFLLASCANKFSLVKRKYNKGYHFAASKKPSSAQKNDVVKSAALKPTQTTSLPVETTQTEIVQKDITLASFPASAPVNNGEAKTTTFVTDKKSNTVNNEPVTASAKKETVTLQKTFKAIQAAQKSASKGGNSDANLILLVILSLFPILALIAMYIHDGHKVTANFWVDLLLHLTFIGYIIFALLVVFNVVDLS